MELVATGGERNRNLNDHKIGLHAKNVAVYPELIFQLSQLPVNAGQHDLWSTNGSNFNFDCRNGFLGVDVIGLDTSHSKIDGYSWGRQKNWNLKDIHKRGLHAKNQGPSLKNVAVHPYLIFQLSQLPESAGRHDLWSKDGSNFHFVWVD